MNVRRLAKFVIPVLTLLLVVTPAIAHADWLYESLWYLVSGFLGFFLWLAAYFLNAAVNLFVIGFANVYTTTGLGQSIESVWVIIRDIMNLAFIFGLLYIGIKIILNSDDSRARSMLAYLIIAALLVNFSLFFTKAVVDVSNAIGAEILLNGFENNPLQGAQTNAIYQGITTVDIGSTFMEVLDVDDLLGSPNDLSFAFIFSAAIFFIISIFVFMAGALILTIRFAALNIYLALSPLMFIGWAFPPFAKYTRDYWQGFLRRAFFAPIYIFMLYLSLFVLLNMGGSIASTTNIKSVGAALPKGADSGQTVAKATDAALTVVPFFALACIFLIASLVIASKMGAEGASGAVSLGQRWSRQVGRGTARFAGRQTVGRGARYAGAAGSFANRRAVAPLNAKLSQKGWVGRKLARGIDSSVGAGLRSVQNASFAGSESHADRRKRVQEQNTRLNQEAKDTQGRATVNDKAQLYREYQLRGDTVRQQELAYEIGAEVRKMSDEAMLQAVKQNPQLLANGGFVQNLTDSHVKALKDSGAYNNDKLKKVKDLRNDATIKDAGAAFDNATASVEDLEKAFKTLGQTMKNMSADRKADLGVDNLSNERVAIHLSDKDIESLEQSGKYSAADIDRIKSAREKAQKDLAKGQLSGTAAELTNANSKFYETQRRNLMRDSKQAGEMHPDLFAEPMMQEYITPETVAQRMRNGVTGSQRENIRDNINNYINTAPNPQEKDRRMRIWQNASRSGNNSSFIAALQIPALQGNSGMQTSQNQGGAGNQGGGIITPGSPGWNGGATGPRPGPQP